MQSKRTERPDPQPDLDPGERSQSQQRTEAGNEGLWTKDLVLNLFISHFMFASYTAMLTIIPLYVLDLGGSEWQTGVVVGSFGLLSIPIRQMSGRWITTFGAKKVAIAGTVVLGIATLLHVGAFNIWMIIPVRVVQGIGLAIGPVATATIIAILAPSNRRAEGMAYNGNAIALANLYSPLLAFWLFQQFGSEAAFVYAGLMSLAGAASALGISASRTSIPTEPLSSPSASERPPLISRSAMFPTLVFLTYTFTTAPVSTFLPQLAKLRNLGNPGLYYTANSITQMLSLLLSGLIADRLGRGSVIVPGLLVVGAAMFTLMVADNVIMFILSGVLNGIGFGMLQPATQSLTVDRAPPRERGTALATLQQAWDFGGSGGAFLVGPLASVIGIAATFGIAGVGTTLGAVGYVAASARSRIRDQRKRPETVP